MPSFRKPRKLGTRDLDTGSCQLLAHNWELRTCPRLLALHDFVDDDFAASVDADDFVDGRVAGHGDVDDVVAGIEQHVHRRIFLEHVLVHRDLSAFGLGVDAERAHALRFLAAKQLFHFAGSAHVIDIAERAQAGSEADRLAESELGVGGFVDVAGLADQHEVRPGGGHGNLRGRELAGVPAINVNVRSGRTA